METGLQRKNVLDPWDSVWDRFYRNCESYVQAIFGQFFTELTQKERLYGWFQQDSATARIASVCLCRLCPASSGTELSARSPDINHCDFFIWSCLKDNVYSSNPRMEEELIKNIYREIAHIPAEQLRNVNQSHFRWRKKCLHVEGQHFQHLLWSVNCNYIIPNVIGQYEYWFIGKIRMFLAADGAPVAVKRRAMNQPT
jgi:hypothetical protein